MNSTLNGRPPTQIRSTFPEHQAASWLKKPEFKSENDTRTHHELQRCFNRRNLAPPTYDIDGDGHITQQDMLLARQIDSNMQGIIDSARVGEAKRHVAADLYKHYEKPHWSHQDPKDYSDPCKVQAKKERFCKQLEASDRICPTLKCPDSCVIFTGYRKLFAGCEEDQNAA